MIDLKRRATAATVLILAFAAMPAMAAMFSPAAAAGGTRYVSPTGSDTANDCTAAAEPCRTIQHAVDAAATFDEILIAGGTYAGVSARVGYLGAVVTQVVFISKTVSLRGGFSDDFSQRTGQTPSLLRANGDGRVVYITGDITPTLEGLTISGGDAAGLGGSVGGDSGGGVYVNTASPAITGCQILTNTAAGWGGGIYSWGGETAIRNSAIAHNWAGGGGGGALFEDSIPVIDGNTFLSNTAHWNGGGLYIRSGLPSVSRNVFEGNTADVFEGGAIFMFASGGELNGNQFRHNRAQVAGGGLSLQGESPSVAGNTIVSNTAGLRGGGVNIWRATAATLDANVIMSNTTGGDGGGLSISAEAGAPLTPTLTNTVLVGNHAAGRGSALFTQAADARLYHTTIAGNTGPGAAVHIASNEGQNSHVALTNTIAIHQTHPATLEDLGAGALLLDGVLLDKGWTFTGIDVWHSLMGDPAFAADGYHLTASSAAIDAAQSTAVADDIDGRRRPMGRADLGAHEWGGRAYLPLVMRQ